MKTTPKKNRVAEVNAALKAMGREEKLTRGRGYYYFREGNSARWFSTSVYVYRADDLSVAEWLHEFDEMRCNSERRA
jgi:hypothetical protein